MFIVVDLNARRAYRCVNLLPGSGETFVQKDGGLDFSEYQTGALGDDLLWVGDGCGSCEDCCSFNALSMGDEVAMVDQAKCMGCGVCEDICPIGAISLKREPSKGEPLDLSELMSKRD